MCQIDDVYNGCVFASLLDIIVHERFTRDQLPTRVKSGFALGENVYGKIGAGIRNSVADYLDLFRKLVRTGQP